MNPDFPTQVWRIDVGGGDCGLNMSVHRSRALVASRDLGSNFIGSESGLPGHSLEVLKMGIVLPTDLSRQVRK